MPIAVLSGRLSRILADFVWNIERSSPPAKTSPKLFVERRPEGDYAIKRRGSERASDVVLTQAKAINRARELNPGHAPLVERVRYTDNGKPDKCRKP
ncbi:MAG: DUF2188 domain-containing protein [Methylovirgula sp.]